MPRDVAEGATYNSAMEKFQRRASATTHVFRPGEPPAGAVEWHAATAGSRMSAVWELTLQCLAWQGNGADEPRLQRSVVRVQRRRR